MALSRKPLEEEIKLISYLLRKSDLSIPLNWEETLIVSPMKDGNMGSLYLFPEGIINMERHMGRKVSESIFIDEDGVDVIVSLNVDEDNKLFELDIWKTNFDRLIVFPKVIE